jgi:hypothetical protein
VGGSPETHRKRPEIAAETKSGKYILDLIKSFLKSLDVMQNNKPASPDSKARSKVSPLRTFFQACSLRSGGALTSLWNAPRGFRKNVLPHSCKIRAHSCQTALSKLERISGRFVSPLPVADLISLAISRDLPQDEKSFSPRVERNFLWRIPNQNPNDRSFELNESRDYRCFSQFSDFSKNRSRPFSSYQKIRPLSFFVAFICFRSEVPVLSRPAGSHIVFAHSRTIISITETPNRLSINNNEKSALEPPLKKTQIRTLTLLKV